MTRDSDSTLTRPGVLQHGGAAGAAGLPPPPRPARSRSAR